MMSEQELINEIKIVDLKIELIGNKIKPLKIEQQKLKEIIKTQFPQLSPDVRIFSHKIVLKSI